MDGDASEVSIQDLDLASMKPRSDLQVKLADAFSDRLGALNRPSRPVKDSQQPVAGGLDLSSTESDKLTSGNQEMILQQGVPAPVTELRETHG